MKLKFITDEVLSRTLAADAGGQNGDAGFARRDFPKRRGFFFQGEANERGRHMFSITNGIAFVTTMQRQPKNLKTSLSAPAQ
jgi:hypothetical protein